ncbi:hypothetical protein KR054_010422, partial [Drosophila jambulina]
FFDMNKHIVRKNGRRCVIECCRRSYRDSSGSFPIKLFAFPSNDNRLKKWVELCHLEDNFNKRTARICSRHFESKYIGINRLKSNAVPTLNLTDNFLLRPDSTVPCEQFEFNDDGAADPIGIYVNPTRSTNFSNSLNVSPSNLETPNVEQLYVSPSNLVTPSAPQLENCSYCQKREENEMFYRNKNYEMFLAIKANKEKIEKLKRANILMKNAMKRKSKRNSKKKCINIFNFINKMPHVSEEAKTICKMLLKKSNSYNSAEKVIAQNINFYSFRTYEYMRDVLN